MNKFIKAQLKLVKMTSRMSDKCDISLCVNIFQHQWQITPSLNNGGITKRCSFDKHDRLQITRSATVWRYICQQVISVKCKKHAELSDDLAYISISWALLFYYTSKYQQITMLSFGLTTSLWLSISNAHVKVYLPHITPGFWQCYVWPYRAIWEQQFLSDIILTLTEENSWQGGNSGQTIFSVQNSLDQHGNSWTGV